MSRLTFVYRGAEVAWPGDQEPEDLLPEELVALAQDPKVTDSQIEFISKVTGIQYMCAPATSTPDSHPIDVRYLYVIPECEAELTRRKKERRRPSPSRTA